MGAGTDVLERFLAERHDLSDATKVSYRMAFYALKKYTPTPFTLDRAGMTDALNRLAQDYQPASWNTHMLRIRRVYAWLGRGDVFSGVKQKRIRREDYIKTKLLTEDEIKRLIRAAVSPRDRAFIAVAAATGARRGELVNVRIRDVQPKPYGYDLILTGKTGTHPSPSVVKDFAKLLRVWLEHHPRRDDPDAYLWIRRLDSVNAREPIHRTTAHDILKAAARRAGFTRNVHLHMLRHTEVTFLTRQDVSEDARRKLHGWSRDSTMPSVYGHLTDTDAVNAGLRAHGIVQPRDASHGFEPVTCGYCGEVNPSEYTYCHYCGTPLSAAEAQLAASKRRLAELLSNDELYAKFVRWLKKLEKAPASRE